MNHDDGYTLIELTIMMVVISIVMAVSAPRFMNPDDFKLRFTEIQLISTLRAAQRIALDTALDVTVKIGTTDRTYTLEYKLHEASLDLSPKIILKATAINFSQDATFNSRLSITTTAATFAFQTNGRLDPYANVTIKLNEIYIICINKETGYVYDDPTGSCS